MMPEYLSNSSSLEKKRSCLGWVFELIVLIIRCLVWLLLAVIAGVLSSVVLPFLLVLFIALRISQITKSGEEYKKVTHLKSLIRGFIVLICLLIFIASFFFVPITRNIEEKPLILGLTMIDLMAIDFTMLIGFGISFLLSELIAKFLPRMMTLGHNENGLQVMEATSEIINSLIFWYYLNEVIRSFPQFNHRRILGLRIQNWIRVTIFVFIGLNIIVLLTYMVVLLIQKLVSRYLIRKKSERKIRESNSKPINFLRRISITIIEKLLQLKRSQNIVYYGYGLKRSINLILSSLLLLLVWVMYIGSNLDKTQQTKRVIEIGTWTFASLLILSFLWLLKDCVLLSWEANAVYKRLAIKLLDARRSLYFLGIIGRCKHDILKLRCDVVDRFQDVSDGDESDEEKDEDKNENKRDVVFINDIAEDYPTAMRKTHLSTVKWNRAQHDLLMEKVDICTLYNVQQVAHYYLTAANALSKETYTRDILKMLSSITDTRSLENLVGKEREDPEVGWIQQFTKSRLFKWLSIFSPIRGLSDDAGATDNVREKSDLEHFQELLELNTLELLYLDKIKTWIERAQNNCLFLANTLRSSKEVVDSLNKVVSVLLIAAVFIMWLLLTGLASTQLLLVVASPLLAATFIFGDTCKSLFQGIIFVYVVHPLDIGDLCIIDDKMLEVKAIGIWITTFSKVDQVGTQEMIYPNSELANKIIVNHKTDFDWNDYVEFNVENFDEKQINKLKEQIEELLEDKKDESMTTSSHSVGVTSSDKDMKIVVRFKHNKRIIDMAHLSYFQCLKEKEKQRTAFILQVQNLIRQKKDGEMIAEQPASRVDAIS